MENFARSRRRAPLSRNFRSPRRSDGVHWVRPELVAEIAFSEWTRDGILRQPSFKGLREDKPAADVTRERPRLDEADRAAGVKLTHPDRVLYPEQDITKRDLAILRRAGRSHPSARRRTPLFPPSLPERSRKTVLLPKARKRGLSRKPSAPGLYPENTVERKPAFTVEDAAGLIGSCRPECSNSTHGLPASTTSSDRIR